MTEGEVPNVVNDEKQDIDGSVLNKTGNSPHSNSSLSEESDSDCSGSTDVSKKLAGKANVNTEAGAEGASKEEKSEEKRSRSRSRSRSRRHRSRGHRRAGRRTRHKRSRSRKRHGESRTRRRSRSPHRHRRHRGRSSSRGRHGHRRRRSRSHQRRHRSRSRTRSRSRERGRGSGSGLVVGFSRRSRSRSRDGIRSNFARSARRPRPGSPKNNPRQGGPSAAPASDKKGSFKDQMREQFMQAGLALGAASLMSKQGGIEGQDLAALSKEKAESAAITANMSEDDLYKLAASNPQVARVLMMRNRAEALTGVTVPKYYSLSAVNPLKYAEQMQKRKMLWSRAKDTTQKNEALWTASSSAVAGSGEEASRFRKLMGIKDDSSPPEARVEEKPEICPKPSQTDVARKQEELFRNLDKEYEFARVVTHSARGVGLGYSSQAFIDPNQFQR